MNLAIDLDKCNFSDGVNVHKLKPGMIVIAYTLNSRYKIIKGFKDKYDVTIQGGRYFPEPTEVNFAGSTFGGSMLKVGWIGYGLHMEFHIPSIKKTYTTTSVRAAEVIGNGWQYAFDWNE